MKEMDKKLNAVDRVVYYYNNYDLECLTSCWHDDIIVYNLKDNKVLANRKK